MSDEKVLSLLDVPVHPPGVQWGLIDTGHGTVQVTRVRLLHSKQCLYGASWCQCTFCLMVLFIPVHSHTFM